MPAVAPMWWLKEARLGVRTCPCRAGAERAPFGQHYPSSTYYTEGFRPRMHINHIVYQQHARRGRRCARYSSQASPLQMQADRSGISQPATCFSPATEAAGLRLLQGLRDSSLLSLLDRLQYRGSRARCRRRELLDRDRFIADAETETGDGPAETWAARPASNIRVIHPRCCCLAQVASLEE